MTPPGNSKAKFMISIDKQLKPIIPVYRTIPKKARSTVVFDTSRTWASWCSFIVSILTILGSKHTYLFPFFLEPGSGLSQARLCRVRLIIRHHHKMFQNQSCHKIKIMLQGWITHLWKRRIGCSSHQIWFLNSNHHQQQHKKSQTSKHMNIKAPNFYMYCKYTV